MFKELLVANHKSASKRAKQSVVKNERNKARKTASRSIVKTIREKISTKDKESALKLIPHVQSLLGKISQNGVIKKKNAARKISRLVKQVQEIK